jgi:hypothetical protein
MTFEDRLATGAPLRLGELAALTGYSREYLRKLALAGVLRTVRPARERSHRRVPVAEAERFARECGALRNATTESRGWRGDVAVS